METEEKEKQFDRGQRAEYVAEVNRIIEEDLRSAMKERGEVAKYHVVSLAPEKFAIEPEKGDFATVSDWLRDITSYLAQADAQIFVSVGDQEWKFHWFGPRAKRGYIVHTEPKDNEKGPLH